MHNMRRQRGQERERKGERERGREGERERGREGERVRGKKGERERGKKGERERACLVVGVAACSFHPTGRNPPLACIIVDTIHV
jgi:hypothetical protein